MIHRGAKQHIGTLALALALNIRVNSTGMSWQHVCLPLKSYLVGGDDQACFKTLMRVMLAMALPSYADDGAAKVTLVMMLPR
jgi:hypothetical protein